MGYWENGGQVANEQDVPSNEFKLYSTGVLPRTGFMDGGRLAFISEILSPDTIQPDTLFRTDLIPVDAHPVAPIGIDPSYEYRNFYLGHTMPLGVEEIHRFTSVVYPELWPGITMWIYSDLHAQRIAFECAPGADLGLIKFQYAGYQSASLDNDGNTIFELGGLEFLFPTPLIYSIANEEALVLTAQTNSSFV